MVYEENQPSQNEEPYTPNSGHPPYSYPVDLPPLLGLVWIDSGASKVVRSTGGSGHLIPCKSSGRGSSALVYSIVGSERGLEAPGFSSQGLLLMP